MGFITNIWAGYWTRSYQQIKDSVLTRLGANVPEITDHTENNPYVAEVDIFAGTHEMLGYYVDNAGRESHIDSCRLFPSGISMARMLDYKVIGNLAYSCNVEFTLNIPNATGSPIVIPAGTIISNGGTLQYVTQSNATIAIGGTVSTAVAASQYRVVTGVSLGLSTGISNMLVVFTDKILHNSIIFYVNSVSWNSKDTLAYSFPTDNDFLQTVDGDGNVNLITGNGSLYGKIPPSGQTMVVDYKVTLGSGGFTDINTLNTIVSTLTLPGGYSATVTNIQRASGGSDVESLKNLKNHIPLSVRTLFRAVTEDDYKAVAELCPGVVLAGVYFNCGKSVSIYIVPDGGGIASSILISTCQTWMDKRKMITTDVDVQAAGEVHIKLVVDVNAANNYANAAVEANVEAALLLLLSYVNQTIGGTVYISDLYEAIENSKGVVNSVITLFKAVPYARPVSPTVNILNWTVDINSSSTATHTWQIVFTDSTHFQLIRDGVLLSSGNPITTPITIFEITMNVLAGSYISGDIFQFVTYKYSPDDLIQLDEPSLPVAVSADLTLNVTGGF